jgi:hypothetical protein
MRRSLLNITGESVRKVAKEALSPTFLLILLGATLLWYTSKLSHEYTTDMPLGVRIDGKKYRLTATIKGRGSNIVAQRLSLKSRLDFALDELSSHRSTETPGALVITPASLQKAINGKINDLEIVQVTDAPDFMPPVKEEEVADKPKKKEIEEADGETPKERRQRERAERREAKAAEKAEAEAAEKSDSK